jgi:hypothetical protein
MSEFRSRRSENSSESYDSMTDVSAEMRVAVRELAGHRRADESVKRLIERASRACGLSYARTRAYWYSEVRAPLEKDVRKIREALGRVRTRTDERVCRAADRNGAEAHDELRALREQVAFLEERVLAICESQTREALDAFYRLANKGRREDFTA